MKPSNYRSKLRNSAVCGHTSLHATLLHLPPPRHAPLRQFAPASPVGTSCVQRHRHKPAVYISGSNSHASIPGQFCMACVRPSTMRLATATALAGNPEGCHTNMGSIVKRNKVLLGNLS